MAWKLFLCIFLAALLPACGGDDDDDDTAGDDDTTTDDDDSGEDMKTAGDTLCEKYDECDLLDNPVFTAAKTVDECTTTMDGYIDSWAAECKNYDTMEETYITMWSCMTDLSCEEVAKLEEISGGDQSKAFDACKNSEEPVCGCFNSVESQDSMICQK